MDGLYHLKNLEVLICLKLNFILSTLEDLDGNTNIGKSENAD